MSTFSIRLPAKVLLALLVLAVVSPAHAARSGGPRHRSAAAAQRARQRLSTEFRRGVSPKAARPVLPSKRGSKHP